VWSPNTSTHGHPFCTNVVNRDHYVAVRCENAARMLLLHDYCLGNLCVDQGFGGIGSDALQSICKRGLAPPPGLPGDVSCSQLPYTRGVVNIPDSINSIMSLAES
jgi:hypothetical protein